MQMLRVRPRRTLGEKSKKVRKLSISAILKNLHIVFENFERFQFLYAQNKVPLSTLKQVALSYKYHKLEATHS